MWLLKAGVDTAEVRPSVVLPIHALPPRPTSQQSYVPLGVRLVVPSATNELVDVLRIGGAGDRFVTQVFGQLGSAARPSSFVTGCNSFSPLVNRHFINRKTMPLVMTTNVIVLH